MSDEKRIKLYTKKGDKGQTSLFTGARCNKADPVFSTLGDLDELNCAIGVLIAHWGFYYSFVINKSFLRKIQYHLINISSIVATPGPKGDKLRRTTEEDITEIEKKIDWCQKKAPKLTQFILPGPQSVYQLSFIGCCTENSNLFKANQVSLVSAQAHVCRALARRAERSVLGVWDDAKQNQETNTLIYLNRLSDFFFAYSRAVQDSVSELAEVSMADMRALIEREKNEL